MTQNTNSISRLTRLGVAALCFTGVLAMASKAQATPILVTVGDNDGYGVGIADNGNLGGFAVPNTDHRSAAEALAVNGAQITDNYSAIFPGAGPNTTTNASVFFGLSGQQLTSATLTVDMGDFQSTVFGGPILANINGVALNFNFNDGFTNSVVRNFVLTSAQLAAANLAGQVILNIDRNGAGDYIAFDYFQLQGEAVPEPATLVLTGLGIAGIALARRRRSL